MGRPRGKTQTLMNHTELIQNLLDELSYRVGIVDLKNKNQQSIISEILTEWG